MNEKQIQAIGNFLTYYQTDLNYIKQFQDFKSDKISSKNYIEKGIGSFYSFLIEFRVVRNFPKGTVDKLLLETFNFIKSDNPNDVDSFALKLSEKRITNGIMTSMASKILFLNNPWEILPMDRLARKTLNQKQNKYWIYKNNLEIFKKENESIINNSLLYTNSLTSIIHKDIIDLKDLDTICYNRIVDKVLWTLGK